MNAQTNTHNRREFTQPDCTKCLAPLQLGLSHHAIHPGLLAEFIEESLTASRAHFCLIEKALSFEEKIRYKTREYQADIFRGLLLRA